MESVSIRELKQRCGHSPGTFQVQVQVDTMTVKPTRQGTEFLEIKFADAEDHFVLRVWGDAPQFNMARNLRAHTFVELEGDWTSGQYGLESKNWKSRPLTEEERAAVLGGPEELRQKQADDYQTIVDLTSSLRDPRLRLLCGLFLTDLGERFRRTGAAREYHHARRGGLVEHVAQMMRSADALCAVYKSANRDLMIAGVLFHDSGKLWENCYATDGFNMPYSEHGELLGHIPMGIELVNKLWRKLLESDEAAAWTFLEPASDEVRMHLLHLIGSHHGEYQFGSPVLPKTPEAILLHHIDNIDAKWEMMKDCYSASDMLGKTIFERKRPLLTNLVAPLLAFVPSAGQNAEDDPAADEKET